MNTELSHPARQPKAGDMRVDVVVVGAGFAGLYAMHMLRKEGFSAVLFEAGDGVGGTWYWNRYPGARCDIESIEYSYSFCDELQQEWDWSSRYAEQPEILRYINHVADRFDLRRDIRFNTRVTAAVFDEAQSRWQVTTDQGQAVSAQFCIMATGCLSTPKDLGFEGLADFKGRNFHTAYWPKEEVDFSGQRVGVIGTGSSGIQAIPHIARQAQHLTVFQRTPNFSIPAWNRELTDDERRAQKAGYAELRRSERESDVGICAMPPDPRRALEVTPEERQAEYDARWKFGGLSYYTSFADLLVNQEANDTLAEYVRAKIREKVRDPAVAELLTPRGYPFGTKRLCADTDYYETYNRDNVSLVDVRRSPIERFTATGLQTKDSVHELDAVVFATGFDALTGALTSIDIRGTDGQSLGDKWSGGPRTYLGIMTAGFPNMFFTTGPGSPSVLYNMVLGNEYHVQWIMRSLCDLRAQKRARIDATDAAETAWGTHVTEVGNMTLFPRADSWYMGANVPGKARAILLYLGGFRAYRSTCESVAAKGYEGFALA